MTTTRTVVVGILAGLSLSAVMLASVLWFASLLDNSTRLDAAAEVCGVSTQDEGHTLVLTLDGTNKSEALCLVDELQVPDYVWREAAHSSSASWDGLTLTSSFDSSFIMTLVFTEA